MSQDESPQNQSENFSWKNILRFFLSLGRISVCKWEIIQTEEISFKSFTNFHYAGSYEFSGPLCGEF